MQPRSLLQTGVYKSCWDATSNNILQKKVCCIRFSLLENFTVILLVVHVPLYFSLIKTQTYNIRWGGKENKTSPQFILYTNFTHQLKYWIYSNWTQEWPCSDQCLGKILFISPRKGTHWSCFKFKICDWSLTIFLLSSEKHMLKIYSDRRVSSGWSTTPCTITWPETGSTILATEGNCQGWKSRAAQSSSSPQLYKTNSKIKPPPNKNKWLGQL